METPQPYLNEAPAPFIPISAAPNQPVAVHKDYSVNIDLFATQRRRPSLGDKSFRNLFSWINYIQGAMRGCDQLQYFLTEDHKGNFTCQFLDPYKGRDEALSYGSATLETQKSKAWIALTSIKHRSFLTHAQVLELMQTLEYHQALGKGPESATVEDFEAIQTERTEKTSENFNELTDTKNAHISAPQKISWDVDFFSHNFSTKGMYSNADNYTVRITGSIALRWKYKGKESKEGLMAQILTPNWDLINHQKTDDLHRFISSELVTEILR